MSIEINLEKNKYICNLCNINCIKINKWNKHINTKKHKLNELNNVNLGNNVKTQIYECKCGKVYKERSGLWKHSKICKNNTSNENDDLKGDENIVIQEDASNNIVQLLIKENMDFKGIIMDLIKNNSELQKQMLDVCKNNNGNNNISNSTVNSHNKTFNLQFFLNEQCKDAINIQDFVDSFYLQVEDLFRVGLEGYVEGISYIIIEKLKEMDIYKRPIHCSDARRDTMFVKHKNIWEKEGGDNMNLYKAIKDIGQKNFLMLNAFRELHPDCLESDSAYNDKYLNLLMKSAGCQKENVEKIIKKIAKEVLIKKE
jgi:hypothetical protein